LPVFAPRLSISFAPPGGIAAAEIEVAFSASEFSAMCYYVPERFAIGGAKCHEKAGEI
jgi:hypothetical protein